MMKKLYKTIIVLLLIPILGFANDDAIITKQKSIKKAFVVNADAGIDITNSYGTVFVTTWDEDKIELDILIKVSGDSENWVNQKINDITIDINALKSLVTAKTQIENNNYRSKGRNNNFEINYVIKIPKNGSVTIDNKYGNISASDLNAPTNILCKYGKITMGRLNSAKNNITIEYCSNSSIVYLKNGNITGRYSGLSIESLSRIDLISDYTDTTIGDAGDVKYTSKYGTVKIKEVNSLEGIGNYLTIKVGTLNNQLKLQTKYSSVDVGLVQAKANSIVINAGYTGVKVGFSPNYAFDFDVSLRYADLKHDSDFEFSNKAETNYTKKYSGYYKKKGVNTVVVTSEYGNVSLNKKL
jgi:hypothetical protein